MTPDLRKPVRADLQVANLWCAFGAVRAIRDISFDVAASEFVGVLGPSGCGKSTLLRIMAGLQEPGGGTVRIDGQDVTRRPAYERDIGLVFQNYALFPHMTLSDNVAYGLRARRAKESVVRPRVEEMLDLVALTEQAHRYPHEISGGQQQRVALARAIAPSPRLLLLDEPLSNLDAHLRMGMREEILRIQREVGVTTILVTHDQEEALSVSDKLIVMNNGQIEDIGTPATLYRRPASAFVAEFLGHAVSFEGTLRDDDGRTQVVHTEGDLPLRVPRDSRHQPGAHVLVIVKEEGIRFLDSSTEVDNVVNAICEQRSYLGRTVRYRCRMPDGRPIALLLDANQEKRVFAAGDRVRLGWDADAAVVVEPARNGTPTPGRAS